MKSCPKRNQREPDEKGISRFIGINHTERIIKIGICRAEPDNELRLTARDLPCGMNCSFGT